MRQFLNSQHQTTSDLLKPILAHEYPYVGNGGQSAESLPRGFIKNFYRLQFFTHGDASPESSFYGTYLSGIVVYRYECNGLIYARRRMEDIRADRVDDFLLILPTCGSVDLQKTDACVHIEPGRLAFHPTSSAYLMSNMANCFQSGIVVKIAGAQLRKRIPYIDNCCGQAVEIRPGASKIMLSSLESVLAEGAALSEEQRRKFGQILIDTVAEVVLSNRDIIFKQSALRQSSHERIKKLAEDFIACNLSDPTLDCGRIAAHCHVTRRYLHAAFSASGRSVGDEIRQARLEQCRVALQCEATQEDSVTEIAFRWGFNNLAHFGRLYKAQYGMSPSEERKIFKKRSDTSARCTSKLSVD